jgi:hypothetical protein
LRLDLHRVVVAAELILLSVKLEIFKLIDHFGSWERSDNDRHCTGSTAGGSPTLSITARSSIVWTPGASSTCTGLS